VLHTISIGLTLVLAIWRYIAIRWGSTLSDDAVSTAEAI
jgi:hypothetical protein